MPQMPESFKPINMPDSFKPIDSSDIPDQKVESPKTTPPNKLAPIQPQEDNRGWWDKMINRNNPAVLNKDKFGLPQGRTDDVMFNVDTSGLPSLLKLPADIIIGALSDPLTAVGGLGLKRSKLSIEKAIETPKLKNIPLNENERWLGEYARRRGGNTKELDDLLVNGRPAEDLPPSPVLHTNKPDIFGHAPDIQGHTVMTGERVRDLYGVEPKEAVNNGWVLKEPNGGYRTNTDNQFDLPLNTAPKLNAFPESLPQVPGPIDVNPDALGKLLDRLRAAKPFNEAQRNIYRAEKRSRFGEIEKLPSEGQDWARDAMSKMKGEYEKVPDFTPIELADDELDSLINVIKDNTQVGTPKKIQGYVALRKVLSGGVPQKNEIATLEQIYGSDLARELMTKRPRKLGAVDVLNGISKTAMSSIDMSAPLRQGLPMIHKKEWRNNLGNMFRAFVDEDASNLINDSIKEMPRYKEMVEGGLSLTDPRSITNREEIFASKFIQKVPGVKSSERAFSTFLNKLRADSFQNIYEGAIKAGVDPEDAAYQTAKYVNVATGRGDLNILGKDLEKHAEVLNQMFFAPRFTASRFNMLNRANPINPEFWRQPAYIRKEYIKSALAVAGSIGTVNALGFLGGAELMGDPRSTDFGKVKIDKTRTDPGASFLQPIVALSRYISGKTMTSSGKLRDLNSGKFGGPTKKDVVERFLRSKLSPVASFAWDSAEGEDMGGNKFNPTTGVLERISPMFLQDVYDIIKEQGDTVNTPVGDVKLPGMPEDKRQLLAIPPAFFGMGSQTY